MLVSPINPSLLNPKTENPCVLVTLVLTLERTEPFSVNLIEHHVATPKLTRILVALLNLAAEFISPKSTNFQSSRK